MAFRKDEIVAENLYLTMPNDVWGLVFGLLDQNTLMQCSLVCRRLAQLTHAFQVMAEKNRPARDLTKTLLRMMAPFYIRTYNAFHFPKKTLSYAEAKPLSSQLEAMRYFKKIILDLRSSTIFSAEYALKIHVFFVFYEQYPFPFPLRIKPLRTLNLFDRWEGNVEYTVEKSTGSAFVDKHLLLLFVLTLELRLSILNNLSQYSAHLNEIISSFVTLLSEEQLDICENKLSNAITRAQVLAEQISMANPKITIFYEHEVLMLYNMNTLIDSMLTRVNNRLRELSTNDFKPPRP